MPKLWTDTIEAHRRAVHDATLDAAAALVAERGLRSVTMSQIAEAAGIGRATLYKYFPDVEAILRAWHERQIDAHLERLARARDGAADPLDRLAAVLESFAGIRGEMREHHRTELGMLLHDGDQVSRAEHRLRDMIRDLIADAVAAGRLRDDIPPVELASYCIHALGSAGDLPSAAAVRRLVNVVLAGMSRQP